MPHALRNAVSLSALCLCACLAVPQGAAAWHLQRAPIAFRPTGPATALWAGSPTEAAVAWGPQAFSTNDGGATWMTLSLPPESGDLNGLRRTSTGSWWAAARGGLFFGGISQPWSRMPMTGSFRDMEWVGDSDAFAGGDGGIWRTHDSGASWQRSTSAPVIRLSTYSGLECTALMPDGRIVGTTDGFGTMALADLPAAISDAGCVLSLGGGASLLAGSQQWLDDNGDLWCISRALHRAQFAAPWSGAWASNPNFGSTFIADARRLNGLAALAGYFGDTPTSLCAQLALGSPSGGFTSFSVPMGAGEWLTRLGAVDDALWAAGNGSCAYAPEPGAELFMNGFAAGVWYRGPLHIWGGVSDTSLASWKLEAVHPGSGWSHLLASGAANCYRVELGTFDEPESPSGLYEVRLSATGLYGIESRRTMTVSIDHEKPTFSFMEPQPDGLLLGPTAAVAIDCTDAFSGTAMALFCVDGTFLSYDTSHPFGAVLDLAAMAEGKHCLAVELRDVAGNSATQSLSFSLTKSSFCEATTAFSLGHGPPGSTLGPTSLAVRAVNCLTTSACLLARLSTAPYGPAGRLETDSLTTPGGEGPAGITLPPCVLEPAAWMTVAAGLPPQSDVRMTRSFAASLPAGCLAGHYAASISFRLQWE